MEEQIYFSRRTLVKSSVFGLLATSLPNIVYSRTVFEMRQDEAEQIKVFHRYPSIDDEIVAEVVGVSHFNLERVRELVDNRPELARATWDWAFGDWETALGAASHVGRRDIAGYLMSKGARPDIFTFAMMGHYDTIRTMIESTPGVESIPGPHGISLLQHAKAGLRSDYGVIITAEQEDYCNMLISYLEKLGSADYIATNIEMTSTEKEKYIGDYLYGEGLNDGLTVKLNSRNMLTLGKLGKSGGSLYQQFPNVFTYNGIGYVEIKFTVENDKVIALTIFEPDLILKAAKV
jgi:hypothetical protein